MVRVSAVESADSVSACSVLHFDAFRLFGLRVVDTGRKSTDLGGFERNDLSSTDTSDLVLGSGPLPCDTPTNQAH